MSYQEDVSKNRKSIIAASAVGGVATLFAGFIAFRYRIASPSQYIVKTGWRIPDVSIHKKTVQLPFQQAKYLSISPITKQVHVNAMSAQRIPFIMPTVWTIGPQMNDPDRLIRYAKLFMDQGPEGVNNTIEGIVQGETRILTANLSLDDLFKNRDTVKQNISEKIGNILDDFGLTVYNANIEELQDLDDKNKYFEMQKRRALQEVNETARIDVAKAIKEGETGEKANQGETRKVVAEIEKDAKLVENDRLMKIAESTKTLDVAKLHYQRETRVAEAEARATAEKRESELQREVEEMRKHQEVEKMRAHQWAQTNVQAEINVREAEGHAEAERVKATIDVQRAQAEAEAKRIRADAQLYANEQEAKGILAVKSAEATGLAQHVQAAGNMEQFNKYLLIHGDMLPELAKEHANAVKGMQPRINYWNTGSGSGSDSKFSEVANDVMRTTLPLLQSVKDQTGIDILNRVGLNPTHLSVDKAV